MLPRPVATVIVALTTIVWLANFFAPFFWIEYKPDPAINGIYLAIIGGALALSRSEGKGRKDKPDDNDGPGDSS